MAIWDPVILGVRVDDLRAELGKRLQTAREAGVPAAKTATLAVEGGKEVNVTIHGLSDNDAKALWDNHLVAGVAALGGKVKA